MSTDRSATRSWSFHRGMRGAIIAGGSVALNIIILVAIGMTWRWYLLGVSSFDRDAELAWYGSNGNGLFILCMITFIFSLAGFANTAPGGECRFARTLCFLVAMTIPVWFFLAMLGIPPSHMKTSPSVFEFFVLAIPPTVACVLVTFCNFRSSMYTGDGESAIDGSSSVEGKSDV